MVTGNRIQDILLYKEIEDRLKVIEEQHEVLAPIYIPTRHRAGITRTDKQLQELGLPYYLVVEPHDYDDYAQHHSQDNLLTLPQDDMGLSTVRNYCLQHAHDNGWLYAWQLDDDLQGFVYRVEGKRLHTTIRPLLSIVEAITFRFNNVAGMSIPNQAFIFGYDGKPPIVYNAMLYQCQLLRTDTGIVFREGVPDDADRTLQLLTANWTTIVARRFGQSSPQPMKQQGGLTDTNYAEGGREKQFEKLVATWPNSYKIAYMKDGTSRLVSRNPYSKFKQVPVLADKPQHRIN